MENAVTTDNMDWFLHI